MILSYDEIRDALDRGVMTKAKYECISSASIDIHLGNKVLVEHVCSDDGTKLGLHRVSLRNKDKLRTREYDLIKDGPLLLFPGEFILAHSIEIFHLPTTISAQYQLNSSMARIGLDHLKAGWCDAGWNNSVLTLELKNVTRGHEIELMYGDRIGQIVFFPHKKVPDNRSYAARGRYNGDKSVSGVKTDSHAIRFGDEQEEVEAEVYAETPHVELSFILAPSKTKLRLDEETGDDNA